MKIGSLLSTSAFIAAAIGWGIAAPASADDLSGVSQSEHEAVTQAAQDLGVEFDEDSLTVPVDGDPSNEGPTPRESLVEVPAGYVYDTSKGSLHDYCTDSPDEFPNPFGSNASFHGPCAKHDMCIERAGFQDHGCDGPLKDDMKNNCRATYGSGPVRSSCEGTADVYYAAVTAASYF